MRLRLDLAYDGTAFHGWARQPGLRTVQDVLERALEVVLRTEGLQLTVAGRTDTGVHARGQVAHVDVGQATLVAAAGRDDAPVDALLRRLNGLLDPDVRIKRLAEAPGGFDARFSALWRRYAYRIADLPAAVDPLARSQVLAWPRELDVGSMNEASRLLLGEHDFAAFCKQREGATTIRSLLDLQVERDEQGLVVTSVRADAFCHSMVRSLMGCLIAVGEGRQPPRFAGEVLTARRRDPRVTVVHAHGLTLEQVGYPADDELAAQSERARNRRTLPAEPGRIEP